MAFGQRIQIARSKLASKISSVQVETMPNETKLIHIKQYDQLALKTFIRGLTGHLQSIIRLRNPKTLEEAMNFVTEEENFRYTQNLPQLLTKNVQQKPQQFTRQQNYNVKPNYYHNTPFNQNYNNQHFNSQHFNNFPKPQYSQQSRFPSQPINIQTRKIKQHFPTNRQVFGPPTDVFKPTGKIPDYVPEPMSTTSRNPTVRNSIQSKFQNTNHFRPSGPRNFASEELYQAENHDFSSEQNEIENYNIFQSDHENCEEPSEYFFEENASSNDIPAEYESEFIPQQQNFQDSGPSTSQI